MTILIARLLSKFSLEPSENAGTRWEIWVKRFDNFLVAKNVIVAGRKKAMPVHYAREEFFELSESINITDEEDYLETKEKLQNYFAPKRNIEYETFVLRQATQQPSEPLVKFNARLVSLSKYCNFTNKEREIKSQIIPKCLNDKVRNKGLKNKSTPLNSIKIPSKN